MLRRSPTQHRDFFTTAASARLHVIDPAELMRPLKDGDPSGPNLEYEPEFLELALAHRGKPEQVCGKSVKAAEAPDWQEVGARATALFGRTRDLRVAVILAQALLETDGLVGLATGSKIIQSLLETQWETVHPKLEADDHNDPTYRINTIFALSDPDGLLKILREVPLVHSQTKSFNLRDIRIASGRVVLPGMADPPSLEEVYAAFLDSNIECLKAENERVRDFVRWVAEIARLLNEKSGLPPELRSIYGDLRSLSRDLREIGHHLGQVILNAISARARGTIDRHSESACD